LIVDDDKIILKTMATKLKAAGYEVLAAEDGGSAIRQARQLQPQLVVLDLNFPPDVGHGGGIPWDGFLILDWLRRLPEMQKIPAIVITGGDLEKYGTRLHEAGVRDVFLKPIDHEALLSSIRWALEGEAADHVLALVEPPTPAPAPPSIPPPEPPAPPPPEPPPVLEDPDQRKILFVDDTNDWRYLATSYMGERGYKVITAEDAVGAMLKVSEANPDLVVLDLNLAGQSALTLLKLLSHRYPEMPILVYTGMELGDEEVSELLRQGARGCLPKGSMEEFVEAIEYTLNASKPAGAPESDSKASNKKTPKPSPASAESADEVVEETISDPEPTVPQRPVGTPKKKTAKTSGGPKPAVPQSDAEFAQTEIPRAPLPAIQGAGDTEVIQQPLPRAEPAPEPDVALPSLEGLRTETTFELLSAVEAARRAAPESPQAEAVPETPAVIPNEVIESAAKSILIIEDDAAFTDTLRGFLESQSFRVSAVTTGAEAMCLIAIADVDIILFDLTLRDFPVDQFYDAVKAVKPHLCKRIIFMTSDESHPKADSFVRRLKGISLWKPFPMEWLLEGVQTIHGAEQPQAQLAAK
jgi:DNA-binding response OmpR family regulator